ncbi:MAG: diphthine--ammonia ligase [Candidatus Aenigmarchaeota archaeon]|nr:diphthine--ammonia ligase [Candidatus Aenigmarchaeota archaeon]
MRVAILYSGGKDSNFALLTALRNGWEVEALISVKPKNEEAYLYHYATAELTRLQAESIGVKHFLLECNEIGPEKEAAVLDKILSKLNIEAIVLGGVGLQQTQINSVGKVAAKYNIKTITPNSTMTSEELLRAEISAGLDIRIVNVAADGLGPEWLGKKLDASNFGEFKQLSNKYGFELLGEGGMYDSFVADAPFFKKRIELKNFKKVWDSKTKSGFIEVENAELVDKQ